MALLTDSLVIDVCLTLATLFCVIYYYLRSAMKFWEDRGVPYIKPTLFVGAFKDLILGRKDAFEVFNDIYKQLEGEKFGGYFEFIFPILIVRDTEYIERILIKDFTHFMDRGFGTVDPVKEPLSTGLNNLSGQQWRNLRYKLTPTFTSGKLKGMFEQITNCGNDLLKELEKYSKNKEPVEAKTVFTSFNCDVIATCAFGTQFSSREEQEVFKKHTGEFFSPTILQLLKIFTFLHFPWFSKKLGLTMFSKQVTEYFLNMTKTIIKFREENKVRRDDFLQLLLTLRDNERNGRVVDINSELQEEDAYLKQSDYKQSNEHHLELTDEVLAAQACLFLGAGSDTVSSTLALTLYCLAVNPSEQMRAQEEVDLVLKKHKEWSYMAIKDMVYLDMVLQESMRLNPFSPVLQRVCTTPYKLPGTNYVLTKGQRVVVPVYPVHHDPLHYPDPDTFNPERFRGNNFRPSSKYMPFGDGPRMCIAMRFAVMEMKVCLARVLSQFSVTLNDKTLQPLKFNPRAIIPMVIGGVWLNFHPRNEEQEAVNA